MRPDRQIAINLDEPPHAINAQPDQKVSILHIKIFEESFNQVPILGKPGQRGQEVAIA